MYESTPLVDPEQDTRIKTHIIPICARAKSNEFQLLLSQPINVLSNAITYVDLNLRGSDTTPLFNTINSTQIYRYKSTFGGETESVIISPGYYTVDELFELCKFRFSENYISVLIDESSDIHEAAQGHYTPIYDNYVYPEFEIKNGYNHSYPTRMESTGGYRGAVVPDGTYTDATYFWTAEKLIAKRWYANNLPTTDDFVIHTVTITPETITIEVPEEGTLKEWTCLGETVKFFDYYSGWYYSHDQKGLLQLAKDGYLNYTYSEKYSKKWVFERVYTSRDLLNYKVEVLDGYNTFYVVGESINTDDKVKYEFVVPPGEYIESEFYSLLQTLFNRDHDSNTKIEFTPYYDNTHYFLNIRINNNDYNKWYFTADDIDHSLFVYRGVLHNIKPNFIYSHQLGNYFALLVKYGKETMKIEKRIPIPGQNNYCESDVYLADFLDAPEVQEIFGFERSYIIDNVKSDRAVDITRNQGMFICDTNLTDTSQNSLYAFNIEDPVGNNQFHDKTNVLVNKGLAEIQHISFRFRDLSNKYTHINDGALLTGFLELSDRVVKNDDAPTLKKLCLNFQTYDDHFQTTLPYLRLHDKIIKDVLIQNDTSSDNPNENIKDLCTCTINNTYYPSFVFPLNEKLLYYGNINAPISIDQQIDVRFNYPFRGNVVCNICEPIPIDRRFKAYDEVYCDFSKNHVLKFELDKSKKYAYQYITRIQVMSNCGLNDNAGLENNNKDCMIDQTNYLPGITLDTYMYFYFTIDVNNRLQTAKVPAGTYKTFKELLYAIFDAMHTSTPYYETSGSYRQLFTIDEEKGTFTTYVSCCTGCPSEIASSFYDPYTNTTWRVSAYNSAHMFKFGKVDGTLSTNAEFNLLYGNVFTRVATYQDINTYSFVSDSLHTQIYPLTLSSYVSPYENIIHIIDASNLPYFYTYGCKYESIKSKISNHIYYCNRQALKLLPKQNEFYLSCYYPCTVIITVSYI